MVTTQSGSRNPGSSMSVRRIGVGAEPGEQGVPGVVGDLERLGADAVQQCAGARRERDARDQRPVARGG